MEVSSVMECDAEMSVYTLHYYSSPALVSSCLLPALLLLHKLLQLIDTDHLEPPLFRKGFTVIPPSHRAKGVVRLDNLAQETDGGE